jgi:hypothetical protein
MSEQTEQLERVSSSIGEHVLGFLKQRLESNPVFHLADLLEFVLSRNPLIAPNSPYRIMRSLHVNEKVNYELLDRRSSRYRVLSVA